MRFEICRLSVAMRVVVGGLRMTRFVFLAVAKEDCIESIIEIHFFVKPCAAAMHVWSWFSTISRKTVGIKASYILSLAQNLSV